LRCSRWPANGDDVAEVLGETVRGRGATGHSPEVIGDGRADVAELALLNALAADAVADEVVPAIFQAVLQREAGVGVLIGLLAVGGEAVEVVRGRQASGGVRIAQGEADLGVGGDVVAEVGGGGG